MKKILCVLAAQFIDFYNNMSYVYYVHTVFDFCTYACSTFNLKILKPRELVDPTTRLQTKIETYGRFLNVCCDTIDDSIYSTCERFGLNVANVENTVN